MAERYSGRASPRAIRLVYRLSPPASRYGFPKGDGAALLDRLMTIAGIDPDAVARRIAADPALGPRVTAIYLEQQSNGNLDQLRPGPY